MRSDTPEAAGTGWFSNLNNQKYSNIIEFTATGASEGRLRRATRARTNTHTHAHTNTR